MNSGTRHFAFHPSSNSEIQSKPTATNPSGASARNFTPLTSNPDSVNEDPFHVDENVPSIPLQGFQPEPFSTASMKFLTHSKKTPPKKKPLVLKTQKIQVSSNSNLSTSNLASPSDLGKIDLGLTPQKTYQDRELSAAGSQTWSLTEGDGDNRTNPFSTPAKQKLLGTKWFPDSVVTDEENETTPRPWKKANIRNKISMFNNEDKDSSDNNDEEGKDDDNGLESEGDSVIEEQKDEEGSIIVEDVEPHRPENRRSRQPTLIQGEQRNARSRRNTGHVEINMNQPDQAGGERRVSVRRNGARNSTINRGSRRSSSQTVVVNQRQYEPYAQLEAKLLLKRSLAFFIALALTSILAVLAVNQHWSYLNLFYVMYAYLAYYGVESVVRSCWIERESWKQREDCINVFDALCGILFFVAIQLKLSNMISVSMIATLPFVATNIGYLGASIAPKAVTVKKALIRFFFSLQVFCITAKLDHFISMSWEIAFSFSWLSLAILGLYLISYAMIFILAVLFSLFRQRLFEDLRLRAQLIGLLWYMLFHSLSGIAFTVLIGASKAIQSAEDSELLRYTLMTSLVVNTILAALTLLAFKPLTKFMEAYNNSNPSSTNVVVTPDTQNRRGQVNLEVVQKESYFVMLSSTYFLPLDKNFFVKNEQKLKKIKDILTNFSLWKSKRFNEDDPEEKPVGVNVLKGYKETLDKQFTKLANRKPDGVAKGVRSTKTKNPTVKVNLFRKKVYEDENSPGGPDTLRSHQRLHLSADDINFKDISPSSEATKPGGEDNLCYLCYCNPPNAVLMRCGHGGICYDCASTLVKKKNECMQCRSPVEAIYRVDPNPKLSDIIKGVELSKVNLS